MKCVGSENGLGKEDFAYISNAVSLEAMRKGKEGDEGGKERKVMREERKGR